jgi:hypothetical protein
MPTSRRSLLGVAHASHRALVLSWTSLRLARCGLVSSVALASVLAASLVAEGNASADEPKNASEPRVMREPGEVVNVIDAFDEGNPFDLNIRLDFDYFNKSAKILRETSIAGSGLTSGGFTTHLLNVAQYSETMARLTPRLDIGIYHDIAAHIALPVVLSDARSLGQIGGAPPNPAATAGAPGETLFSVPFNAPTRSGLQSINAGFDFDILNQARDQTKPTWLFGFEGRFSVGTPMHACNANPAMGQLQCADPSDIKRDGKQDVGAPNQYEGSYSGQDRGPGITRGTTAIEVHTIMSRRLKYVEPYGGFSALFEFANTSSSTSSDFTYTNADQSLVNHLPLVGTMMLGMMIIPWENREKFGRLTFDLRVMGQYHSEGRDYSELFDALGSSAASSLRSPQWAGYMANQSYVGPSNGKPGNGQPQSVVDTSTGKVYTTGLTDVLAYGSYRLSGSVMWQASEYVKFQFGLGYSHDQAHVITGDSPCSSNGNANAANAGPCHSGDSSQGQAVTPTGIPNPNYRGVINDVGRRYWVDNSNTFDLFASAVVMF